MDAAASDTQTDEAPLIDAGATDVADASAGDPEVGDSGHDVADAAPLLTETDLTSEQPDPDTSVLEVDDVEHEVETGNDETGNDETADESTEPDGSGETQDEGQLTDTHDDSENPETNGDDNGADDDTDLPAAETDAHDDTAETDDTSLEHDVATAPTEDKATSTDAATTSVSPGPNSGDRGDEATPSDAIESEVDGGIALQPNVDGQATGGACGMSNHAASSGAWSLLVLALCALRGRKK